MALTKRQKEFLDFFSGFVEENGYCPSYEEIARGLQLSSLATVHKHVCVARGEELSAPGLQPKPVAGTGAEVSAGASACASAVA